MVRKRIEIPVPDYLYKYLKSVYNNVGVVSVGNRQKISTSLRYADAASYWSNPENSRNITVSMYNPTPMKGYQLARQWQKMFKTEMCEFANRMVESGFQAKPALECFLTLHGLNEFDYKLDRAYKIWQRYNWRAEEKKVELLKKRGGL